MKITDTMVEIAAQAIHAQCCNKSGRGRAWKLLPDALKASFRAEARDALEAVAPLFEAA